MSSSSVAPTPWSRVATHFFSSLVDIGFFLFGLLRYVVALFQCLSSCSFTMHVFHPQLMFAKHLLQHTDPHLTTCIFFHPCAYEKSQTLQKTLACHQHRMDKRPCKHQSQSQEVREKTDNNATPSYQDRACGHSRTPQQNHDWAAEVRTEKPLSSVRPNTMLRMVMASKYTPCCHSVHMRTNVHTRSLARLLEKKRSGCGGGDSMRWARPQLPHPVYCSTSLCRGARQARRKTMHTDKKIDETKARRNSSDLCQLLTSPCEHD